MKLERILKGFERTIVAFSANGYPISFPSNQFKILENKIIIPKPKGLEFDISSKRACLLFHTHNEFVKNIRSVTLYGTITQKAEILEFEPKRCYKFKQGGIFNTLRFILMGKKRVKKFLKSNRKTS